MESLCQRLGPHAQVRGLADLDVEDTPQYNSFENKLQNDETFPILDKEAEVNPEWADQNLNTEILLPRGDNWPEAEWYQKHDADGNSIGKSNQNPIFEYSPLQGGISQVRNYRVGS